LPRLVFRFQAFKPSTLNLELQTSNTEEHHHPGLYHRRIHWKEYFLEFFQIFLAVTKPTGQGMGLGLLLSYDIIKAHGGKIKVETKEGEAVEFIIQLPIR
jgi:light-regulated signal transduction histidine kinase (bacteriophytochrome)